MSKLFIYDVGGKLLEAVEADSLTGVFFTNRNFSYADFRGMDIRNCGFTNCNLMGATFDGASIISSEFNTCEMTSTSFKNAKCRHLRFPNSVLNGSDWDGATVGKIDFTNAWTDDMNFKVERHTVRHRRFKSAKFSRKGRYDHTRI